MSEWRTFEKRTGGMVRCWQIRREGIRCYMGWGVVGGVMRGSSMTLDDEAHAERHFKRKISEKRRQGYVEVAGDPPSRPPAEPGDAKLLDVMRTQTENRRAGSWEEVWAAHEPVPGHEGAYVRHFPFEGGPGPFREYLVLVDDGRKGLRFIVKDPGYDAGAVSAFLDFVTPRWHLLFDGTSHHKVRLDAPIGPFSHVLFCGPSLCRGSDYGGRAGRVFPIHDCEIADADTETFVEARTQGRSRETIATSTWDREPFPVTDLRYDLQSTVGTFERPKRSYLRQKKFKTGTRKFLEDILPLLIESTPESFVEVRSFRGDVMAVTRRDLTPDTLPAIDRFVRGLS
ncbi:WGR domain-containing protein [Actinomadura rudentiformis]|uniref:WGR domain-containing protein n=1 Tax=Actinomadura rudentiformis TaxID=359158 RepID=A0A6H9Y863_9ACTN|nr:WGR domain-containing protein [Actinomadura rudentiformis]KAB2341041.1 WGR domain-containing protein [Actinomadura rudentiformis]